MAGERAGHTLSATALVHKAYLKLAGPREVSWAGRLHFYAWRTPTTFSLRGVAGEWRCYRPQACVSSGVLWRSVTIAKKFLGVRPNFK